MYVISGLKKALVSISCDEKRRDVALKRRSHCNETDPKPLLIDQSFLKRDGSYLNNTSSPFEIGSNDKRGIHCGRDPFEYDQSDLKEKILIFFANKNHLILTKNQY